MGNPHSEALVLEARAKVNLCLAISYPPADGYHPLRSVFQELDLHDVVRVHIEPGVASQALQTRAGTHVLLTCNVDGLDPRDNLVFRAIDAAEQACGPAAVASDATLVIEVEKHIPAGGGLGGGSSDAAATLKAYAQLADISVHDERLVAVARALGADVAFFLYGGCALMGGRGDVFECSLPPFAVPIVLMGSNDGLSTATVYRAFDDDPVSAPDADALAQALRLATDDTAAIAALCANNLEPAACAADPRIQQRLHAAREHPDVLNALVSGSGSTSFAICADEAGAQRFAHDIAPVCDWVRICRVPRIAA